MATPFENRNFNIYRVVSEIKKQTDQFRLHIARNEKNFKEFALGTVVSTDGESSYVTQHDGECIIFPNPDVAIGQRAALMVVPVTLFDND